MDKGSYFKRLPEWYQTERDTEQILSRLTDTGGIRFYIGHADPYIRRLAIIRLGSVKTREAYALLRDVAEDRFEAPDNRSLALIFLEKLNDELSLGFYIHPQNAMDIIPPEDYRALLHLDVTDGLPEIRFNFESALIESQLQLDLALLKVDPGDTAISLDFSLKDWFVGYITFMLHHSLPVLKKAVRSCGRFALSLPKRIWKLMKKVFSAMKEKHRVRAAVLAEERKAKAALDAERKANASALADEHKEKAVVMSGEHLIMAGDRVKEPEISVLGYSELPMADYVMKRKSPKRTKRIRPRTYTIPLGLRFKDAVRGFFRNLFLPLRVIYRFKWVILGTLAAMYIILSFTIPGKAFLFRINPGFYSANAAFLKNMEQIALSAFEGKLFAAPVATDASSQREPVSEATDVPKKKKTLVVTAPKGLYLRKTAEANGDKIVLMQAGTQVVFQDERTTSDGVTWYSVSLSDGTSGWANAQWLKEE